MSSDLKINEINKLDKVSSSIVNSKDKGSNRDLLQEFSEILSKITSAVKTAKQDADKSVAEVKIVENKQTKKSEPDYRQFENTNETKYPKDTFISREEVEHDYKNSEVEANSNENVEAPLKETKESSEAQEVNQNQETEETSKESDVSETNESEKEVLKVSGKEATVEGEVKAETQIKGEQVVVANGESKEVQVAKEEIKVEENLKPKKAKEEKEVIKEEVLATQENTKTEASESKKEVVKNVNNEAKLNAPKEEIQNEKSELKTQIKQEIVNHLDKKEVKNAAKQNDNIVSEDKIALKSELVIEKSLESTKIDINQNLNNQTHSNSKEKMMKSMIDQAKNILAKQFDLNMSNTNFNQASQGANNSIQNVQATLASKNTNLASKAKPLPLPKTYATRTMHKVEEIIKELSKTKDGKTISVRLDPPSLGNLKVDVSLKDGSLVARITAESSQVGQYLKDKAAELQQLLRKSGINVDEVNVWLGSQSEFADTETRRDFEGFNQEFFENTNEEFDEVELSSLDSNNKKEVELDHWVA